MKRRWILLFYLTILSLSGIAIYLIVQQGKQLQTVKSTSIGEKPATSGFTATFEQFRESLGSNFGHPVAVLILQIIAIIICARLFGFLFNKIGQPTVIGEIIAGIVLGPSVLGLFLPGVSQVLFPVASLGNLQFLSQIGLILFMFVIGMELDLNLIRKQASEAVVISHASILIPYTLGMGLAYYLFLKYAPTQTSFVPFALFMGIAMSITAFPVLARIIHERGLTRTPLGSMAITCAASDDVTAWCILAAVIAIVKAGSFVSALYTIGLILVYVVVMLLLVRPFFNRLGKMFSDKEGVTRPVLAIIFMVMLLSAYATEILGIHALFGAFLAGVIMPPGLNFRKIIIDKIEDVSVVLLLPLFFVYTGLRTQIGLLNEGDMWVTTGLVILVAVVGKFGGSALPAKFVGQTWKDSLSIGALMNTRGLMELIVLNIGYDLGILSPEIFAMMVLMALITTFMTGPALDFINWAYSDKKKIVQIVEPAPKPIYQILLSFGSSYNGRKLVRLANQMLSKHPLPVKMTAMNIEADAELSSFQMPAEEKDIFGRLVHEAKKLNVDIETVYHPAKDIRKEVIRIIHDVKYDFILVDAGKPLLKGTFLGGLFQSFKLLYPPNLLRTLAGENKLSQLLPVNDMLDEKATGFIEEARCSVGVLIDREFDTAGRILVPVFSADDLFLLKYAAKFMRSSGSAVTILDAGGFAEGNRWQEEVNKLNRTGRESIHIIMGRIIDRNILSKFDLMLVSYDNWEILAKNKSVWLEHIPSSLVIRHVDSEIFKTQVNISKVAENK